MFLWVMVLENLSLSLHLRQADPGSHPYGHGHGAYDAFDGSETQDTESSMSTQVHCLAGHLSIMVAILALRTSSLAAVTGFATEMG